MILKRKCKIPPWARSLQRRLFLNYNVGGKADGRAGGATYSQTVFTG